MSTSIQSISSIFLNSNLTTYYQKYKTQQHQLKQNRATFNYELNNENNDSVNENLNNFDRKKEDAINRIIRNEKIKQIRVKIYEYELLKEYQTVNNNQQQHIKHLSDQERDLSSSSSSLSSNIIDNNKKVIIRGSGSAKKYSPVISNESSKFLSKSKKQQQQIKNFIPSPKYNNMDDSKMFDSYNQLKNDDEINELEQQETFLKNNETDLDDEVNTTFDENTDLTFNDNDFELDDLDETFDDNDSFIDNLDDDNYESGIEDDNFTTNQKRNNHETQIQSNINRMYQNSKLNNRRSNLVKPGYEIYQIGGPANNSISHTLNLSSAAQSTFQLKISIISNEVKNIVNVLKQVCSYLI